MVLLKREIVGKWPRATHRQETGSPRLACIFSRWPKFDQFRIVAIDHHAIQYRRSENGDPYVVCQTAKKRRDAIRKELMAWATIRLQSISSFDFRIRSHPNPLRQRGNDSRRRPPKLCKVDLTHLTLPRSGRVEKRGHELFGEGTIHWAIHWVSSLCELALHR